MNDAEKAVAKKIGDDFIQALPGLLSGECARLPASVQPFALGVVTMGLPMVVPAIQAWFDALVA